MSLKLTGRMPAGNVRPLASSQVTAAGVRTYATHLAGCECRTCRRIRRKLTRKESS